MYDNGYIVKCRSILTNDICLSEASHKADVFLVCISYLTYSLKKCINNLAVWKIRVNTHTHTHNYRASIYNKTFKFTMDYRNQLSGVILVLRQKFL